MAKDARASRGHAKDVAAAAWVQWMPCAHRDAIAVDNSLSNVMGMRPFDG
jgi:hypothetical protein